MQQVHHRSTFVRPQGSGLLGDPCHPLYSIAGWKPRADLQGYPRTPPGPAYNRTYAGSAARQSRHAYQVHRRPGIRLQHPRAARRPAPGCRHRLARRADLSDHLLRLRRHRARRQSFQPAALRQHLYAHHEPDHGGVRGAHGVARTRRRRAGGGERPGGAVHRHHQPARRGRRDRRVQEPVRRHLHAVRRQLPAAGDQHDFRRSRTIRRISAAPSRRARACSTARPSATRAERAGYRSGGRRSRTRPICR